MSLLGDLFGGPEAPKQRDIDAVQGNAEEAESNRLRGVLKSLFNNDTMNEGDEYQGAADIQFGSDAMDINGSTQGVTESSGPDEGFLWTEGRMPENLTHSEALAWLTNQPGALEESGLSTEDAQWLGRWIKESGRGDSREVFNSPEFESTWDANVNETNQRRLKGFQDAYNAWAPQII